MAITSQHRGSKNIMSDVSLHTKKATGGPLAHESERLAEQYGVDRREIRKILDRVLDWESTYPYLGLDSDLDKIPYDHEWREVTYNLNFEQALKALGWERAAVLYQARRLEDLAARESFVRYLNHFDTPLYSHEELEALSDSFVTYLEHSRAALLRSGYPETDFRGSFWLAQRLSRLYHTKQPLAVDPAALSRGEFRYFFAERTGRQWTVIPTGARPVACTLSMEAHLADEYIYLSNGDEARVVRFDESGDEDWFSEADRIGLELLKQKLLKIKIRVVRELQDAVRDRDRRTLLDRVLEALTGRVTGLGADEIDFLLEADAKYAGFGYPYTPVDPAESSGQQDVSVGFALPPGGLTDLLMVAGHFEKEISIGTYTQTWERLRPSFPDAPTRTPRMGRNYYELLRDIPQHHIDGTFDEFLQRESAEKDFWKDFAQRVQQALATQRQIALRVNEFQAMLTAAARTGELPLINYGLQVATPNAMEPEPLKHSPDFRSVTFEGVAYTLTIKQAVVIRILYEAWESGVGGLSLAEIQVRSGTVALEKHPDPDGGIEALSKGALLDLENKRDQYLISQKITDLFRTDDPEGRRNLIRINKGVYSLAVPARRQMPATTRDTANSDQAEA